MLCQFFGPLFSPGILRLALSPNPNVAGTSLTILRDLAGDSMALEVGPPLNSVDTLRLFINEPPSLRTCQASLFSWNSQSHGRWVDSPLFSTIVLFKNRSLVFHWVLINGYLKRRIPGKNGIGRSPRIYVVCIPFAFASRVTHRGCVLGHVP